VCLFLSLLAVLTIIILPIACSPAPVPAGVEHTATASFQVPLIPYANPSQEASVQTTTDASVQSCSSNHYVQFAQGGTSFYTAADLDTSDTHCFTLNAAAGQLLMVSAVSESDGMAVEVFSQGESTPIPSQSSQSSYWVGVLPASQQYQVALNSLSNEASYFLTIELPANINLMPGQSRYEIAGTMIVNQDYHPDVFTRVRYRVYLEAGKTLAVDLLSPNPADLSLGIYGAQDGQPYKRFEILGNSFILDAPLSQFYFIDIYGISGSNSPFTLQLTFSG